MVLDAGNILLVGAVLLFVSIVAGKAGYKFGVPMLLLFLGVGMAFGSDGVGIQFNSPTIAQFIGMIALSVILFSGGMDTKFKEIRPVLGQGIILATLGVMLTTAITGGAIYLITDYLFPSFSLTLYESLLLAAVMSSTDSASVFSILRSKGLKLKENMRPLLEFESGSNDPMANILTILFIQIIQVGEMSFGESVSILLLQISIGAVAGYVLGRVSLLLINRLNIDNRSFYPVLLLACVFFIFSFTNLIQGNGYLAVYIAGLVVGNNKMPHHRSTATFFDVIAWLSQLVMFLTLGLLVNPKELIPVMAIGLLISVVMIFLARPATVFLCLLPFRKMSTRAKSYVSWVGLRGAVPIIFATYPLTAGIENASLIFNIVFFITIVSLVVQGTTVNFMAKKLKLTDDTASKSRKFNFEELPAEIKSTLSEIDVTADMLVKGDRLIGPAAAGRRTGRDRQARRHLLYSERTQQALCERQADDHFAQQKKSGHGSPGFQYLRLRTGILNAGNLNGGRNPKKRKECSNAFAAFATFLSVPASNRPDSTPGKGYRLRNRPPPASGKSGRPAATPGHKSARRRSRKSLRTDRNAGSHPPTNRRRRTLRRGNRSAGSPRR